LTSIGLDIESYESIGILSESKYLCFNEQELHLLTPINNGLLLGFSAKEALFKCLSTEAGGYFDFLEAVVLSIDPIMNTILLQLRITLSERLPNSMIFECSYAIAERHVWTIVSWARDQRNEVPSSSLQLTPPDHNKLTFEKF
jgi:enterobactin synthetase component D